MIVHHRGTETRRKKVKGKGRAHGGGGDHGGVWFSGLCVLVASVRGNRLGARGMRPLVGFGGSAMGSFSDFEIGAEMGGLVFSSACGAGMGSMLGSFGVSYVSGGSWSRSL